MAKRLAKQKRHQEGSSKRRRNATNEQEQDGLFDLSHCIGETLNFPDEDGTDYDVDTCVAVDNAKQELIFDDGQGGRYRIPFSSAIVLTKERCSDVSRDSLSSVRQGQVIQYNAYISHEGGHYWTTEALVVDVITDDDGEAVIAVWLQDTVTGSLHKYAGNDLNTKSCRPSRPLDGPTHDLKEQLLHALRCISRDVMSSEGDTAEYHPSPSNCVMIGTLSTLGLVEVGYEEKEVVIDETEFGKVPTLTETYVATVEITSAGEDALVAGDVKLDLNFPMDKVAAYMKSIAEGANYGEYLKGLMRIGERETDIQDRIHDDSINQMMECEEFYHQSEVANEINFARTVFSAVKTSWDTKTSALVIHLALEHSKKLADENEALEDDIVELKSQADVQSEQEGIMAERNEKLEEQNQDLEAKMATLVGNLRDANQKLNEESGSKELELEAEAESLRNELSEARKSLEVAEDNLSTAQSNVNDLNDAINGLESDLEESGVDVKAIDCCLSSYKKEQEKLEVKEREADRKISKLDEDIKAAKNAMSNNPLEPLPSFDSIVDRMMYIAKANAAIECLNVTEATREQTMKVQSEIKAKLTEAKNSAMEDIFCILTGESSDEEEEEEEDLLEHSQNMTQMEQ